MDLKFHQVIAWLVYTRSFQLICQPLSLSGAEVTYSHISKWQSDGEPFIFFAHARHGVVISVTAASDSDSLISDI